MLYDVVLVVVVHYTGVYQGDPKSKGAQLHPREGTMSEGHLLGLIAKQTDLFFGDLRSRRPTCPPPSFPLV